MQKIILVLGTKILINLHQPLILFFGVHDPEHFFLITKNIMFHKSKQFVIAGALAILKKGVQSCFQLFEFSSARKNQADVDNNFAGPRLANQLLRLRKGLAVRGVMVCPVIIGGQTKDIVGRV